jgi:acyl-CoA thioesterase-1
MKTGSPARRTAISRGPSARRFSGLRALLLLFVCSVCSVGLLAAAAETIPTIVFFGDSITAGYGLANPERDAYPARIQAKLDAAGLKYRVVNAGLSGDTTTGGLSRVDWALRQPVDVFVLALGGNDGLRGTSPAVTEKNLQGIIDRVRARYPQAKIVLTGMQMPDSMGPEYTKAFRELYPALAERNKAAFVPFLLEGVGGVRELNQNDRIHPTAEGAALVAENVWKVLRPLL